MDTEPARGRSRTSSPLAHRFHRSRPRRWRSRGVTMVEFALVAPLFFAALFGSLDGGLLMFSAGAINHAAGLGMIEVAQDGTLPNTDQLAWQAVTSGGFSSTGFAKLDEVDIYLIHVDPVTGAVTQDTNTCGGVACVDRYTPACVAASSCVVPWPPGSRHTDSTNLTNVGITVKCHYNYLAFNSSRLNLTQTRYFRLEPTS